MSTDIKIRTLRADEIECRVQSVQKKGCILLLYKDARCDMRILDEVFGLTGWQRSHEVINGNLFCTVEIFDDRRNIWIKKQDVGVESQAEKEKGQASDSFKRACFNIGIGRELYSTPFIWIPLCSNEIKENNNRVTLSNSVKFFVKEIGYNTNREVEKLLIIDQDGIERYPKNKKKEDIPSNTSGQSNRVNSPKENKPQEPGPLVLQTIQNVQSIDQLIDLCNQNTGAYKDYRGNKLFNETVNKRIKELENG